MKMSSILIHQPISRKLQSHGVCLQILANIRLIIIIIIIIITIIITMIIIIIINKDFI